MKKLLLSTLGIFISSFLFSQILTVNSGSSVSIASGSSVSLGGLEIAPAETYVISGANDVSRSATAATAGPYTTNFDPSYPEPEFTPKTLNGSNTFISSLSDGYENNIEMYMNCNTTYDNPPY
jgi:hypothetical protein